MDNGNRCIPGFIYIPSWKLLDDLINNWGKGNDMQNVAGYFKRNRSTVEPLPIIKPNLNYNFDDHKDPNYRIVYKNHALFNGIFDAAAIGQYLGGTHRGRGNDIGFVNETCLVKYNCYDFIWKQHAPYIIIDNQEVPIYNLHIHSKNLKKFINEK